MSPLLKVTKKNAPNSRTVLKPLSHSNLELVLLTLVVPEDLTGRTLHFEKVLFQM